MGYMSDVTICTTIQGYEYMLRRFKDFEIVNEIKGDSEDIFSTDSIHFYDEIFVNTKDNYVLIDFKSVKWYSTSDTVIAYENIIKELKDMNIPVNICIIGEDSCDMEGEVNSFDIPQVVPYRAIEYLNRNESNEESLKNVVLSEDKNDTLKIYLVDMN